MDGLLVVDKPVGLTSHDVVARVRRSLNERRVGHTGTLDPAASGVLPIVIGRATRLARFLSGEDKKYRAIVRLGIETDSYDSTGLPVGPPYTGTLPDRGAVERVLDEFRGTFLQRPPAYSAKKIGGRRSYRLARSARRSSDRTSRLEGSAVPTLPAPVSVTVRRIELLDLDGGRLMLDITCSAGFYVRSLAHDVGDRLKTGAHLAELRRVASGHLALADAVPLARLEESAEAARLAVVPLDRMLPSLGQLQLTEEGVRRAIHGRELGAGEYPEIAGKISSGTLPAARPPIFRLMSPAGGLIGLAKPMGSGLLHPFVILV
jgi:tRNA pseudouridine55 synthase